MNVKSDYFNPHGGVYMDEEEGVEGSDHHCYWNPTQGLKFLCVSCFYIRTTALRRLNTLVVCERDNETALSWAQDFFVFAMLFIFSSDVSLMLTRLSVFFQMKSCSWTAALSELLTSPLTSRSSSPSFQVTLSLSLCSYHSHMCFCFLLTDINYSYFLSISVFI